MYRDYLIIFSIISIWLNFQRLVSFRGFILIIIEIRCMQIILIENESLEMLFNPIDWLHHAHIFELHEFNENWNQSVVIFGLWVNESLIIAVHSLDERCIFMMFKKSFPSAHLVSFPFYPNSWISCIMHACIIYCIELKIHAAKLNRSNLWFISYEKVNTKRCVNTFEHDA